MFFSNAIPYIFSCAILVCPHFTLIHSKLFVFSLHYKFHSKLFVFSLNYKFHSKLFVFKFWKNLWDNICSYLVLLLNSSTSPTVQTKIVGQRIDFAVVVIALVRTTTTTPPPTITTLTKIYLFWTQNYFEPFVWTLNIFWPRIFFGPKFFFLTHFSTQIYWDLIFIWTINFLGSIILLWTNYLNFLVLLR